MFKRNLRSILTLILVVTLVVPIFATTVSAEYENTYTNTGNMRNDIIGVALTQVGYTEGTNNYTKYGVWYGQPNSPWCGMFVSWCAKEAGIPVKKQYIPLTIVSDGQVLKDNLALAGKDEKWLQKVLREKDATVKTTWLLTVDGADKILFYKKEA